MAIDIDQSSLIESVSNGSIGPIADLSYSHFPDLQQFSMLCDDIASSTKIFVLQMVRLFSHCFSRKNSTQIALPMSAFFNAKHSVLFRFWDFDGSQYFAFLDGFG
jgi:hypothetical protein